MPERFSLKSLKEKAPPVNPAEAMRKQLVMGIFDAVSEEDITCLAKKLKEMAMKGDLKAMRMLFDLVLPSSKVEKEEATASAGIKMLASAIEDLVDEIRVHKEPAGARNAKSLPAPDDDDDD